MIDAVGKTITKTKTCKIAGLALSSWAQPWFYVGKISKLSESENTIYVRSGGETFYMDPGDCVVIHP